jgi:hypothetical protein
MIDARARDALNAWRGRNRRWIWPPESGGC